MTENRRIFFNIVATYGRSLFALVCGLFTSRWVLQSLGEVDYGLFGVIGGLTVFIAFFNGLLSAGVSRFYAVSVGEAKKSPAEGLEKCRQWFNTALSIHTIVPLLLMAIGYPIGAYAITHEWLNIPADRVVASLWVFRFTCISCFIGMVNVPFQAMYTAKQYIAELTIYSFITTTLNIGVVYYMVSHPGDWLAKYALWGCLMHVIPHLIICIRAMVIFPECRLRRAYLWSGARLKQLMNYSGWIFFGALGGMLRSQGIAILINRAFGPRVNSAMTIGNTVSSHVSTLSASMQGAFSPAIMTAYGAGEMEKMRALAYRACKFGTLLLLLFLLPLSLELPYVLKLWLKTPPAYTAGLCWCVLAMMLIDKTAVGHMIAVNASGKVALYHLFLGSALILTLPLAYLFVRLGWGVYSVGVAMVLTMAVCAWGRVWFARKLVGMSARHWLFKIFMPILFLIVVAGGLGASVQVWMPASFLRLCLSTLVVEVAFCVLTWSLVLDKDEKTFVREKLMRVKQKFLRRRG